MIEVLIVDDHALVRQALTHLIQSRDDLQLCGAASSVAEARELIISTQPDLVLLDLCLGNSRWEGVQLMEEIHRLRPATKVLISSMQEDSHFVRRALGAGADGFVSKAESVDSLSAAIDAVLQGNSYVSDRVQAALSNDNPEASANNRIGQLSRRELEIFELVGSGASPNEIAERLEIGLKTVDAHRQNIRRKLGLASMGDLIRQATIWATAETQVSR